MMIAVPIFLTVSHRMERLSAGDAFEQRQSVPLLHLSSYRSQLSGIAIYHALTLRENDIYFCSKLSTGTGLP